MISSTALSRAVVSRVASRSLTTSPRLPPQCVVLKSTAPASPAPPNLRKSLRLTALGIYRSLGLHLCPGAAPLRRGFSLGASSFVGLAASDLPGGTVDLSPHAACGRQDCQPDATGRPSPTHRHPAWL